MRTISEAMDAMARCAEGTVKPGRVVCVREESAVALLEVILALVLFVAAAAVVTSGLNSALHSLDHQRVQLHMVNLASSILAEIQLGIRPLEVGSAQPFPAPWEEFTVELAITSTRTELAEAGGLTHVEAIIRHSDSTVVHRLSQGIRLPVPKQFLAPGEEAGR